MSTAAGFILGKKGAHLKCPPMVNGQIKCDIEMHTRAYYSAMERSEARTLTIM